MKLAYDKYIVAFSGGKDSTACFLHLLDLGVPKEKIELWHNDVDGKEETFMDWECTPSYCEEFAKAFGVPIYFSWKEGGFKREMLKNNQKTAPISFETPDGLKTLGGTRGKESTRMKFPQVSIDLSVRWCSPYLKIDVCTMAIRNQKRFEGINTIVISGERGEESTARSKYKILEPDKADNRNGKRVDRYVDRWRPIRDWPEEKVWEIIERYKVRVHPCYYLGWSRCSCKFCIFGNADQFASGAHISPKQFNEISSYEKQFGCTIKRNESLNELVAKGEVYSDTKGVIGDILARKATSKKYTMNIIMKNWHLPAGAYGESCGPS